MLVPWERTPTLLVQARDRFSQSGGRKYAELIFMFRITNVSSSRLTRWLVREQNLLLAD